MTCHSDIFLVLFQILIIIVLEIHMGGSRLGGGGWGGTGGQNPPENSQNIGFLSNTAPDPLKNHSMLDHQRHISETSFKWPFACGPKMAHL